MCGPWLRVLVLLLVVGLCVGLFGALPGVGLVAVVGRVGGGGRVGLGVGGCGWI